MDCSLTPLLASQQAQGNHRQHSFHSDDWVQHTGVEIAHSPHRVSECGQGRKRGNANSGNDSLLARAHAWVTRATRRTSPVVAMRPPAVRSNLLPAGNKSTRPIRIPDTRSEEHTSELQSLRHLVCRL